MNIGEFQGGCGIIILKSLVTLANLIQPAVDSEWSISSEEWTSYLGNGECEVGTMSQTMTSLEWVDWLQLVQWQANGSAGNMILSPQSNNGLACLREHSGE